MQTIYTFIEFLEYVKRCYTIDEIYCLNRLHNGEKVYNQRLNWAYDVCKKEYLNYLVKELDISYLVKELDNNE